MLAAPQWGDAVAARADAVERTTNGIIHAAGRAASRFSRASRTRRLSTTSGCKQLASRKDTSQLPVVQVPCLERRCKRLRNKAVREKHIAKRICGPPAILTPLHHSCGNISSRLQHTETMRRRAGTNARRAIAEWRLRCGRRAPQPFGKQTRLQNATALSKRRAALKTEVVRSALRRPTPQHVAADRAKLWHPYAATPGAPCLPVRSAEGVRCLLYTSPSPRDRG